MAIYHTCIIDSSLISPMICIQARLFLHFGLPRMKDCTDAQACRPAPTPYRSMPRLRNQMQPGFRTGQAQGQRQTNEPSTRTSKPGPTLVPHQEWSASAFQRWVPLHAWVDVHRKGYLTRALARCRSDTCSYISTDMRPIFPLFPSEFEPTRIEAHQEECLLESTGISLRCCRQATAKFSMHSKPSNFGMRVSKQM